MPILRSFGAVALLTLLPACSDLHDPTAVNTGRAVAVRVIPDSIAADGVSRATVEVVLDRDTPLGTEVTVSTSAGALAGAGQSAAQQLKYNAGSRSDTLVLVSGTRATVATVTAATGKSFSSDSVRFTAAAPASLELSADRLRATANGQDVINLTAKLFRALGAGAVSEGTRVRFDVFSGGVAQPELSATSETSGQGSATHRLVSRAAATYDVIASSGGSADTLTVVFATP